MGGTADAEVQEHRGSGHRGPWRRGRCVCMSGAETREHRGSGHGGPWHRGRCMCMSGAETREHRGSGHGGPWRRGRYVCRVVCMGAAGQMALLPAHRGQARSRAGEGCVPPVRGRGSRVEGATGARGGREALPRQAVGAVGPGARALDVTVEGRGATAGSRGGETADGCQRDPWGSAGAAGSARRGRG